MTRVGRWHFAKLLGFTLAAAGLALLEPMLLVAAAVPLMYLGYGYLGREPAVTLSFTREADTEQPQPGSEVTVRLSVTNDGDSVIPDLRIVDGVPGPLPVIAGDARQTTTLLPGETVSLEYTLRARRGIFEFEPVRYRARSVSGSHSITESASVTGLSQLRCLAYLETFPLPRRTRQFVGTADADTGGEGVEFYGSREYHPTDSAKRIDWNRLASTGELTTLIHREEHSRTVIFLLDATDAARVGGGEGTYTGIELGAYAIERGVYALLNDNDNVGFASYGASVSDRKTFVQPGGGDTTRQQIRYALAGLGPFSEDALSANETEETDDSTDSSEAASSAMSESSGESAVADGSGTVDRIVAQTPEDAMFVIMSPLLGDRTLSVVDSLAGRGRAVSILSPDVIQNAGIGNRLAHIDRRRRIQELQRDGIPVTNWDAEEPLSAALNRGKERIAVDTTGMIRE